MKAQKIHQVINALFWKFIPESWFHNNNKLYTSLFTHVAP